MSQIGVLALQGAVEEHLTRLNSLPGVTAKAVRTMEEIKHLEGLILPGGESSTMGKLLDTFQLTVPLKQAIHNGLPVWGTCAGMILLAKKICNQEKTYLQTMDICVKRNAYGGQLNSFQTHRLLPKIAQTPLPLTFIRAPYIESSEPAVEILATIDGKIVAAAQKNMLVTAFHPELTDTALFHQFFIEHFIPRK